MYNIANESIIYLEEAIFLNSLASIDLGFSFCKAIINGKKYIIKSVVGDAKKLRFEDIQMQRNEHDYIVSNVQGHEYFVSDLAIQQSTIKLHSLKANRFDQTATKVLINTLFGMGLGEGNHESHIVSGLPVSHYTQYKDDIRTLFLGNKSKKHEYDVQINGNKVTGSVMLTEGKFIPQPFGSLLDVMLDEHGDWERKDLARKIVAVIDIGFGTSDIYVCDQLDPMDDLSFSTSTAMSTVYSLVAREIVEHGGIDFSGQLHRLEDSIRKGSINIHGETLKLKPIIDFAVEQVASQLIGELYNKWNDQDWRIDKVLISGGGGIALSDYLLKEFKNTELVPDSQWSVVRGYDKWGRRTWRDIGSGANDGAILVSTDKKN